MEFITRILDFIFKLPPFEIIHQDESAVRLRFGKYTATLGAGIHWRVPIIHSVITCKHVPQVIDLPSQAVLGWFIEATVIYEVEDAKKAILEVMDFDDCIRNFTLGIIGSYVVATNGKFVASEMRESVREDLILQAQDWGLNVIGVEFKTLTQGLAIKLLGEY
jgi:regulator of protease activity HflC (stomatin/prohibitin superfamily)